VQQQFTPEALSKNNDTTRPTRKLHLEKFSHSQESSTIPLLKITTNSHQQHQVMKRSSSHASAPPAINITTTEPISSPLDSPKSPDSNHELRFSYDFETTVAPRNSRKDSGNTTYSADLSSSTSKPLKRSKSHDNKHVNAHSYCGRHSTEYLFGGHSIREFLSNLKHRKDSREQE